MTAELNFIRQQGFPDASSDSCAYQYPALMLQPRVVGSLVLVGVFLQSWVYFAALWVLLWWSAAIPRLNPFDLLYNVAVAKPRGRPAQGPARSPRRFAQALAGAFMVAIAVALWSGARGVAWALEAILLAAIGALIFGRFCLGSYVFHLVTGQAGFANRTLPWSRAE